MLLFWIEIILPIFLMIVLPTMTTGFVIQNDKVQSTKRAKEDIVSCHCFPQQDLPSMIVFDLDNTLWTPELYQLRNIKQEDSIPVANKDVKLFPGSKAILQTIQSQRTTNWSNVTFAIASRTKSVDWAFDLLKQFEIIDLFEYIEIYPGSKITHFKKLRQASGIPFHKILFFDDSRDGKFGNCIPVSNQLGVLSVHCPNGLVSTAVFYKALKQYAEWDKQTKAIVECHGSLTTLSTNDKQTNIILHGTIKRILTFRRFGFIQNDKMENDIFFHFNNVLNGAANLKIGDSVSFVLKLDEQSGKERAIQVMANNNKGSATIGNTNNNNDGYNKNNNKNKNQKYTTKLAFSMNMPFAALLANEYKTLESRNGTMFVPYPEGTQFLLHVGRRIYPDGDKHIDVMKNGGLSINEIQQLKSLPTGYGSGMVIAILEIGKTYETTIEQRSIPEFERKVAAFGNDSGRIITEIRRVQYLKQPFRVSGKGGIFKASVPIDVIPDGWE